MPTTAAPISIYYTSTAQPESSENESATQASSVHAQFAMRERYDFTWANASERTGQTGMVQGSRGYQLDTKTEYLYDAGLWRLSTPYAEFSSAANSVTNSLYTNIGALSIDTAVSTSTTFINPVGHYIEILEPGVYGFSFFSLAGGGAIPLTGQSHTIASLSSNPNLDADQISRGYFTGGGKAMVPMPFFYCTTANQRIYFFHYQTSGSTQSMSGRLRIGRFS